MRHCSKCPWQENGQKLGNDNISYNRTNTTTSINWKTLAFVSILYFSRTSAFPTTSVSLAFDHVSSKRASRIGHWDKTKFASIAVRSDNVENDIFKENGNNDEDNNTGLIQNHNNNNNNRRIRPNRSSKNGRRSNPLRSSSSSGGIKDNPYYDEKERRELEWIVRNTNKILGPNAPLPGSMDEQGVHLVSSLMQAWARRSSKKESKSPHVVERLLHRLLKERDAGNDDIIMINTALYNTVLEAWSNSNDRGSAERSEEILNRLEEMYQQGNDHVKPDRDSYNSVIKAYVKNGDRAVSLSKVEGIIERMERCGHDQNLICGTNRNGASEEETPGSAASCPATVCPNRRSYNLLLYALANSSLDDAPIRAERILQRMLQLYQENLDNESKCRDGFDGTVDENDTRTSEIYKPDTNSFNQVLAAWSRGHCDNYESSMDLIYQQLLGLPESMGIRPDTLTFNTVMRGWLKSNRSDALHKIEQVLQVMENSYNHGNNETAKPDRITINTLAAAYAKMGNDDAVERSVQICRSMERKYRIKPDQVSYNIKIDGWCKSGRKDAPEKAMDLLSRMEHKFKLNRKPQNKPDGYTYSSVIGCYVRSNRPDACEKAEELLKRMHDLYINYGGDPLTTSVCNSVINAWAAAAAGDGPTGNVSDKDDDFYDVATKRIKEILYSMEGNDPGMPKADRITYNTVMKAMQGGKEGDAEYAEELLQTLERKGQKDAFMLPDSYSYLSVIYAYGRSNATNKAEKALEVLKRQIQSFQQGNKSAKPNLLCFNAALNACAFYKTGGENTSRVFNIALEIYELLQEYVKPDQTTYGTLLRTCSTLLPRSDSKRESMVETFFQEARENGCVGPLVITQMKFAASPEQHLRLIGRDISERIELRDLPIAWTRGKGENTSTRN